MKKRKNLNKKDMTAPAEAAATNTEIRIQKADMKARTSYDYRRLEQRHSLLIPCSVEEEKETLIGNYDADVIRTMMKWECGGLSAWLPADALGVEETMEKDGLRVMKSDEEIQEEKQRKIDAAVLEIKKVTDLSNAEIENCCNLLLGKPGMFDDMTMSEFLTAVQNIEELDMLGELDIRAEFYVAVDDQGNRGNPYVEQKK